MKIVTQKNKTSIVLEHKEIVEVKSQDGKMKVKIKCLGNTLHLDENTNDYDLKVEEEKAIKAMEKYIKKQKKGKNQVK